jgi:hypothetical protein
MHSANIAILVFVMPWYTSATAFAFTRPALTSGAARPVSAGSVPAGRGQDDVKPLLTFDNNIARNYHAL